MTETVLDRLVAVLSDALAYNAGAFAEPVALLWPDEAGQWRPVVGRLLDRLPLVLLDDFDTASRRGPACWIRCVVAGTIDAGLPTGTPVVYLPGVGRRALRAVESCPPEIAPIAELQYRSQWFSHPNNRDWSVRALLSHADRGLGLRIADDADTSEALAVALDRLLDERVDRLAAQVLDAEYFRDLVNPDPVRSLLGWLDDPKGFRARLDPPQWTAFVQQCKANYAFDPSVDGEVTAARKLGSRSGGWANVWRRFLDTPNRYPGVVDQLRKGRPMELFVEHPGSWPQDNETAEDQLRNLLRDFDVLTPEGARGQVARLEVDHAWRRRTVWANLDCAPLAFALEQLVTLAEVTSQTLPAESLDSFTTAYAQRGWRADDAALRALASARSAVDRAAVSAAVGALYRSWLDAGAKTLQSIVGPLANSHTYIAGSVASTASGTVTVFVDGLRLDLAYRVRSRLASAGFETALDTSLAALPTVTQTAKPALMPVAKGSLAAGPDLHPRNATTGTTASIQVLRTLMADNGVQVLTSTDSGDPTGTAWTEVGEIDHRGHDVGTRLVEYLDDEVGRIVGRVRELLEAGWQLVQIVTDHGWLLLPGGMEKIELPPATAELKKGRCARLKEGAVVEVPTVPWFWDQDVRIALAPGASCFEANKEYEHGGVSPQECIVPRLRVTAGSAGTLSQPLEITRVRWLGLLCRIELSGSAPGARADLRALAADPRTSIAEDVKETGGSGKVSLIVPDEEHEGEPAHLVLVGPDGQILAQRDVVVGSNR